MSSSLLPMDVSDRQFPQSPSMLVREPIVSNGAHFQSEEVIPSEDASPVNYPRHQRRFKRVAAPESEDDEDQPPRRRWRPTKRPSFDEMAQYYGYKSFDDYLQDFVAQKVGKEEAVEDSQLSSADAQEIQQLCRPVQINCQSWSIPSDSEEDEDPEDSDGEEEMESEDMELEDMESSGDENEEEANVSDYGYEPDLTEYEEEEEDEDDFGVWMQYVFKDEDEEELYEEDLEEEKFHYILEGGDAYETAYYHEPEDEDEDEEIDVVTVTPKKTSRVERDVQRA